MESNIGSSQFRSTIGKSRTALIYVGFISMFVNVLMLTVPLYMLQVFDRVLASRSEDTLIYLTIAAVGTLAVLGGLDMLRTRILTRMSSWLDMRLGPITLSQAVSTMLQSHTYGTQALRDITQIRLFIASPALLTLFDSPWVPIYLFVIYLLHPILGYIGLVGAIILFALAVTNDLITRKPLSEANNQLIRTMHKTDVAVNNAEVIESMGLMPGIVQRWFRENLGALKLQEKANDRAGILTAFSKFLRMAVQIAILGIGAYLVIQQEITGGVMIAASIILSRALQPVEQAIGSWKSMVSARAAYRRLKAFLTEAPMRETDISLPSPEGYLSVDRAVFVPPGASKATLKGITFKIDPGEILAIVGPSAAGKSTLARLIVGAWKPYSGVVRLDGADVYSWNRQEFGRHVGYLPQDIELFEATIAENISRLTKADPEQVVKAAKRADVHELILKLPNGYSTELGKGGMILSAGQRQRVGLARALFGSPQLIVLDEPDANLDAEGELALVQVILEAKQSGATLIFISHRPNLVSNADKVLYLRNGAIELFGNREEVMSRLTRPVVVENTLPNKNIQSEGQ
jgi:PrtD family type I secretion system ABC transporter